MLAGYAANWDVFQSTPPVKAATCFKCSAMKSGVFQSTPPVKAATAAVFRRRQSLSISIHAAREGGDAVSVCKFHAQADFNPRRP